MNLRRKFILMTSVHDNKNNVVAYLDNQLIISAADKKLIGVILGHCVYGAQAKLIGIYFKGKIINIKGEIIATLKITAANPLSLNKHHFIAEGWTIIKKIKEHFCSFIEEKPVWSEDSLTETLLA